MEFEIWAVSDNYTKYDQILQKYELKVITTKEKKNNRIHIPYPQYKQKRYIKINNLGEMLELANDLKKEIIISDEGLFITIYDDYIE